MPYATLKAHHEEMVAEGVQFKEWEYDLLAAPCNNPAGCCYGFCCVCCFAYQQRDRILKNTGMPYQPCGGSFCCFPTPVIEDSPNRECCMCCEACCIPYTAVLVNRDLIMQLYRVDYDQCDECIITCVICLDCIFTILACIDDSFENLRDIIDLLLAIIMSCALAQQESTLDVMTGEPTILGGYHKSDVQKQFGGPSAVQIARQPRNNPQGPSAVQIARQPPRNNYAPQTAAYGHPQASYGQAPPSNYGQPQAVRYGQAPPSNYGQPVAVNYGQAPPSNYGKPNYAQQAPQYGQSGVGYA